MALYRVIECPAPLPLPRNSCLVRDTIGRVADVPLGGVNISGKPERMLPMGRDGHCDIGRVATDALRWVGMPEGWAWDKTRQDKTLQPALGGHLNLTRQCLAPL